MTFHLRTDKKPFRFHIIYRSEAVGFLAVSPSTLLPVGLAAENNLLYKGEPHGPLRQGPVSTGASHMAWRVASRAVRTDLKALIARSFRGVHN
jgi:hypothetical protein